jgi:hypothetical protein
LYGEKQSQNGEIVKGWFPSSCVKLFQIPKSKMKQIKNSESSSGSEEDEELVSVENDQNETNNSDKKNV